MIKQFIVAGLLCLFSTPILAQNISLDFNKNADQDKVSPRVREKMDEFQLQIREIVNVEKANLDLAISKVDKEQEQGKLTQDEARQKREELALESSEIINSKIQAVNFDLDELIKSQVAFSILNGNLDAIPIANKPKKKPVATHNITGYVSYGFMGFSDKEDQSLSNHLGFANNTELGLSYTKQFNVKSAWSLKSGLFMSWRTIRLEDNYKFVRNAEGQSIIELADQNLDKSKLRGSYLMLPLGLQYTFGHLKTTDDFTYFKKSKFSIAANAYGGVKLRNNNIIKGDGVRQRDQRDYNLNPFIYGAQLTLSYGAWNFYARNEFSNYFKDNSFDNRKMFQFGINFGF